MKNITFILLLMFSFTVFGTGKNTTPFEIPDSTTQMGQRLPIGRLVFNLQDNKMWRIDSVASATDSLQNIYKSLVVAQASVSIDTTKIIYSEGGNNVMGQALKMSNDTLLFGVDNTEPYMVADADTLFFQGGSMYEFTGGRLSVGNNNIVSLNSVAIGTGNNVQDQWSLAVGKDNTVLARSFAGGDGCYAGSFSIAFGNNTVASGSSSAAFGFSTDATGNYSTVVGGSFSGATAVNSIAQGFNAYADGAYGGAFGYSMYSDYTSQYVFGRYNDRTNANEIFGVGIGTGVTDRRTGFSVLDTGTVLMPYLSESKQLHQLYFDSITGAITYGDTTALLNRIDSKADTTDLLALESRYEADSTLTNSRIINDSLALLSLEARYEVDSVNSVHWGGDMVGTKSGYIGSLDARTVSLGTGGVKALYIDSVYNTVSINGLGVVNPKTKFEVITDDPGNTTNIPTPTIGIEVFAGTSTTNLARFSVARNRGTIMGSRVANVSGDYIGGFTLNGTTTGATSYDIGGMFGVQGTLGSSRSLGDLLFRTSSSTVSTFYTTNLYMKGETGHIGLGNGIISASTTPTYNLSMASGSDAIWGIEPSSSGAGVQWTLQGSNAATGSDADGGDINIKSGKATGDGGSRVVVYVTDTLQGSGTTDRNPRAIAIFGKDSTVTFNGDLCVNGKISCTDGVSKAFGFLDSNTVFITVTTTGTWYQITGLTLGRSNHDVFFDSDSIYVTETGIYQAQFDPSMIKGTGGAAVFEFGFGINNQPPTTSARAIRTVSSATDYGTAGLARELSLNADDRVKLYVRNLSNADNIKFVYGQFQLSRQ